MSKNGKVCSIDSSKVESALDKLSEENRKEAILKSLIAGGKVLKEETTDELLRVLPNAGRGGRLKDRKNNPKPMTKGIRIKADKDYKEVSIHIMGDFRLKWFESGTDDRYLKKPLKSKYKWTNYNSGSSTPYRGKIKGKGFFKKARESSNMMDAIMKNLDESIKKLLK